LATLDASLRAARAGEGQVVLIEGHAGVGKSTLLNGLAERSGDLTAMAARPTALEVDLHFSVAVRLLEQALAGVAPDAAAGPWHGPAALAATLFPGIAPEPGRAAGGDLFPLLHGLHWLTANLAAQSPLLLCVDDAQWADRPSLRFLCYLAERIDELPVCLAVAARPPGPEGDPEPLAALRSAATSTVRPAQLSDEAVTRLLRHRWPAAEDVFCKACADSTGGNPLLLVELLGELGREGIEPTAGHADRVRELASDELSRRVSARLGELPEPARLVATLAAVLGPDSDLRHLAALGGFELSEAAAASSALAAAGLFPDTGAPAFRHPLLEAAVRNAVPARRREALHLEAARLLHDEGAGDGWIAAHLAEAPPAGQAWAFEVLTRAAARAMDHGAPDSAARWLRRAVGEAPSRAERCRALAALGEAETAIGDAGAADRFAEAASLEEDPARRARLRLAQAQVLAEGGDLPAASEVIGRARAELPAGDDALARELDAAWVLFARHVPSLQDDAVRLLDDLVARPRPPSDAERTLLAAAANQAAFAAEPREEAVRLARRALEPDMTGTSRHPEDTAWAVALAALGWADEVDAVERLAQESIADARRRGSIAAFATASYARAYAMLQTGRIADAAADCRQAIEARPDPGWLLFPFACVQLAWAELERGAPEVAGSAIERWDPDRRWADAPVFVLILEARGRIALAGGDPGRALDLLEEAGGRAAAAMMPNPAVVPWRQHAVRAALALGNHERASELATEELALARRFGAPRSVAAAQRSAGLADPGEGGLALIEAAAAALDGSPFALEHARTLVDLGAAQRRRGRRADARVSLRRGMELADRCGALALRERAAAELGAAGARPRRAALRGVESLTPSELRVARMAADGMTNREIAQALFVTVKAVQWHLRNTYRKLDVDSRDDLPAALSPGQ
jgi:DNA-binding CsgD family transcriptional regulator